MNPPCDKVTFLSLETLEILFEKIFVNKKCSFIVGQHFGNIFLLRQQIATKNIKCEKIGGCCFLSQQHKKLNLNTLIHSQKTCKIFGACARANPSKFCSEISGDAHLSLFPQNFKFLYINQFLSYRNASYMKKHLFLMKNSMKSNLSDLLKQ